MAQRSFLEEYQIGHGVLGEGSQGQVIKARHKRTQQMVAVKIISTLSESGQYAYDNEVKTYESLAHAPGLVRMREHFHTAQEGVIILDLLERNLMHDCILRDSLSEGEAMTLFRPLCVAVMHMHQRRVAHLDLKPENVLLDAHSVPYLCDMGAAAHFREGFRYRGSRGTPGYSAPEMHNHGYYYPPAADVWSLGIILHLLLVGCFPYHESGVRDGSPSQFDMAYFYPVYLESSRLSRHAKDLLSALLAINPKQRPTVQQVLDHPFLLPSSGASEVRTKAWIARSVRHITKRLPRAPRLKLARPSRA